ncbi:MAG: hypothetical protein HY063_04100 [Bacteroidetes bacterium]|nr:hypothetical protein [Bacteroidota bacterium]
MKKCESEQVNESHFPTLSLSRFLVFTLFTFHFSLFTSAQVEDSIRVAFHSKPKLIGGINTKNTFINGFRSPIYTAYAGLDFNHTVRIGAGLSWLHLSPYENGRDNTPFYLTQTFSDTSGVHEVHPELQFRYINLFFEYVYFKSKKWQFSVPLQIGIGGSSYQYNYNGKKNSEDAHTILLYEPTVSGQYRIIKWFGVELDVGYRIMLVTNKNIKGKFDSPIYNAGIVIYWGELYRMVFPKK